jgi:2-dehydro-3-deoxygluconokinase
MAYDFIALGETMVAFAPRPGESWRGAHTVLVDHAGAESNTCVGLARLGFRTAWVSRLGTDAAGDRILDSLSSEGVDTQWAARDGQRPTGMMLKDPGAGVRYYRSESAASVMGPEVLAGVPVAGARAVLVTGVTALIGPRPREAGLALLSSARGLRIVDPNLRAGLWGSSRRAELVHPFVTGSDLLLTGSGELVEILRGGDEADPEALARRAAEHGPREVVVRGAAAIGVLDAAGVWRTLDIRRDAAVDAIGAGDAFNAGYIAVRLKGGGIDEALQAGARCGAAVTSAPSDTAGFPRSLDPGA